MLLTEACASYDFGGTAFFDELIRFARGGSGLQALNPDSDLVKQRENRRTLSANAIIRSCPHALVET
jgi:hypothetical protein